MAAKSPSLQADAANQRSLALHARYRGKVQMLPKCPISGLDDFSVWYTPGVAAPCLAIKDAPERAYEFTNKGNLVAVVSNGTRVLGLGNIGPLAGLPVMEGKALLFKYLGGVDAVPLCIRANTPDDIVRTVEAIAPSFGGINLEDISQPDCFRVLGAARERLDIPVWHDDQQGSATVAMAGLLNALSIVGKRLDGIRICLVGIGAANFATYRLLRHAGVSPGAIVACDSKGTLHRGRDDIAAIQDAFREKWEVCRDTNADNVRGGIDAALRGADVCIAFSSSGPGVINPEWIRGMKRDAIVFACANPVPEIWPADAKAAGARIVATGRSDMPNQVNNALVFPGIFRGVLDVRASTISDDMAIAAAHALAAAIPRKDLSVDRILPSLDEPHVAAEVAAATGVAAQEKGLAQIKLTREELRTRAVKAIAAARAATQLLMKDRQIASAPAP